MPLVQEQVTMKDLADQVRALTRKIDDLLKEPQRREAMHKLEAGTYGACANCEAEIAEARLKAVPFATLCRACQEAQESLQAEQREVRPFEAVLATEGAATRRVR